MMMISASTYLPSHGGTVCIGHVAHRQRQGDSSNVLDDLVSRSLASVIKPMAMMFLFVVFVMMKMNEKQQQIDMISLLMLF